jgi:hypothetical protein
MTDDLAATVTLILACSYLLLYFSIAVERWRFTQEVVWWVLVLMDFIFCLPLLGV